MEIELKTYAAPKGAKLSNDYTVKINGHLLDVYRGLVWQPSYVDSYGGNYSFAYFDFEGDSVEVEITSNNLSLSKVKVLPESKKITPAVNGNVMTFKLSCAPCQLSIEPNGKQSPLLLFVNPIEQNVPDKLGDKVKYYGPGIHNIDVLELTDGETLYIEGGAILYGSVQLKGENIVVRGRGILDGVIYFPQGGPATNLLHIDTCKNVLVEGIILKDGWHGFCTWIAGSDNVVFDNVKIIESRSEHNDGINDVNSSNVTIKNCFIRSDDDCICTKGFGYENNKAVDGYYVYNCVLWTDKAHIWRLGAECRAEVMRNMHFKNIDVLHYVSDFWNGDDMPTCISVQPAEEMLMENIIFEDIRINHAGEEWVIEVKPKSTRWALNPKPGMIKNVLFKNISIDGEIIDNNLGKIRNHAPDEAHTVENVRIENFVRHGIKLKEGDPDIEITGFVKDVVVV